MSNVLEMEGYTFSIENGEVKVRVNNKKSDKEIWRSVPEKGPVWNKVMKAVDPDFVPVKPEPKAKADVKAELDGEAALDAQQGDGEPEQIIDGDDAPTQPDDQPEPEAPVKETKAARKRRLKAEREAAKAAAASAE